VAAGEPTMGLVILWCDRERLGTSAAHAGRLAGRASHSNRARSRRASGRGTGNILWQALLEKNLGLRLHLRMTVVLMFVLSRHAYEGRDGNRSRWPRPATCRGAGLSVSRPAPEVVPRRVKAAPLCNPCMVGALFMRPPRARSGLFVPQARWRRRANPSDGAACEAPASRTQETLPCGKHISSRVGFPIPRAIAARPARDAHRAGAGLSSSGWSAWKTAWYPAR
jgi:hypothetical protein